MERSDHEASAVQQHATHSKSSGENAFTEKMVLIFEAVLGRIRK
jgi:hypothetical protein